MEESKAKGKIAQAAGEAMIALHGSSGTGQPAEGGAPGESPKQVNPNLVIPKRGTGQQSGPRGSDE